jgi:ribosomal protein L37AE/L43A
MKVKKIKNQHKKVTISDDTDLRREYVCQYCNCNTVIRMDDLSLYCNHCHNISLIEDLQEVQQLQEPKTLDNQEVAISTTPLPGYGDIAIKKPPNYKGAFKSLSEKGIKIKDYTVTDGAGRPIHEE